MCSFALIQVLLAFVSWFFAAIAPAARMAFEDRDLPQEKRRGTSIFPLWPLMPLLMLSPVPLVGSRHIVSIVLFALQLLLLLAAVGNIAYWTVRHRRAG